MRSPTAPAFRRRRHDPDVDPALEQLRARVRQWSSPTPRRVLHQAKRWLERRGFEVLGAGVHARVFVHPDAPGYVLKVFSVANPAGQATLRYLKQAMVLDNPLLPNVYRIYRVGPVAIVSMERLVKKSAGLLERLARSLDIYFEDDHFQIREFRATDLLKPRRPVPAWQKRSVTLKQIQDVCDVLGDIYAKVPDCGFDMHAGNFMFRPLGHRNYQLVLTDPMC